MSKLFFALLNFAFFVFAVFVWYHDIEAFKDCPDKYIKMLGQNVAYCKMMIVILLANLLILRSDIRS